MQLTKDMYEGERSNGQDDTKDTKQTPNNEFGRPGGSSAAYECIQKHNTGNEAHTRITVENQLKGAGDPDDSSDDSSSSGPGVARSGK